MTKVLIHLPETMKRKLDALKGAGYTIPGIARRVLEAEFKKPSSKRLFKTSKKIEQELEIASEQVKADLDAVRPKIPGMVRRYVQQAFQAMTPQEQDAWLKEKPCKREA